MLFLTFDLGTTLFKVALFDDAGNLLALQRIAPPIAHPEPSHWELDVNAFSAVLVEACGKLRADAGDRWKDLAAVSFATQANSFTLLDEADEPLLPLILWPDRRAADLSNDLWAIASVSEFRATTGLPRFGVQFALAKLLWV